MSTKIEWCDETWNPTTGCDQVSLGCDHCYALTLAKRLKAMGSPAYQQDGDPRTSGPGFAIQWHEDRLDQPLRWTRPRRIFVNSMSDLFHPKVPDEFIAQVWAVMWMATHHTFQVLTKRPRRMRALLLSDAWWVLVCAAFDRLVKGQPRFGDILPGGPAWPLGNVWCGTSVEDQQRADERIPPLLETPAAVRFLSCEPLLGPVDLRAWLGWNDGVRVLGDPVPGDYYDPSDLHWIIVGGESGPGARPMHPQWARDLRDQATAAGVPFLFKQWGAWVPEDVLVDAGYDGGYHFEDVDGVTLARPTAGKHASGRVLDGRTWDEFPQEVSTHG